MPLFIFPEGGRTKDGQVQPFMRGPAYISIRSRVPLVPMALIGTFELLPIHTHHFRPRPVKLVVGKPIDPSGYSIRQTDELTARLREEILHLYESHAAPGDLSPSLATASAEVVREDS
jgi:1-acyl-sn-glycerol-3-phosphate acyltransferase